MNKTMHLDSAGPREHDVLGLEIAMHYSTRMCVDQSAHHGQHQRHRATRWHPVSTLPVGGGQLQITASAGWIANPIAGFQKKLFTVAVGDRRGHLRYVRVSLPIYAREGPVVVRWNGRVVARLTLSAPTRVTWFVSRALGVNDLEIEAEPGAVGIGTLHYAGA
jgi:hypothetical protein